MNPKEWAESSIKIPGSPFWNVFRSFGTDEILALVISVVGTAIISFFTTTPLILALAGPIIEKLGFFPAHIKETWEIYKTTPKKRRKSLFHYTKSTLKEGSNNMFLDIFLHDPIYILLMLITLTVYPTAPLWFHVIGDFVVAVFIVAAFKVGYIEGRYFLFKQSMKRKGLLFESFHECRFYISASFKPEEVITQLGSVFNLSNKRTLEYEDHYFENLLKDFSGRTAKIRLRKRTHDKKKGFLQTVQIIYSLAYQIDGHVLEQFRYFPIKKEKIYALLNYKMPKNIGEIKEHKIRKFLRKVTSKEEKIVRFKRILMNNAEVLISADKLQKRKEYYLLELKVYKDTKKLKEIMRYVMTEFPVAQTTKSKTDIV